MNSTPQTPKPSTTEQHWQLAMVAASRAALEHLATALPELGLYRHHLHADPANPTHAVANWQSTRASYGTLVLHAAHTVQARIGGLTPQCATAVVALLKQTLPQDYVLALSPGIITHIDDCAALHTAVLSNDGRLVDLRLTDLSIPQAHAVLAKINELQPGHRPGCAPGTCQCRCDRAQDCQDCHRCTCQCQCLPGLATDPPATAAPAAPAQTPDTDLLHRTLAHITANPHQWNQRLWITHTTCDFAARAALLHGATIDRTAPGSRHNPLLPLDEAARQRLGLTLHQIHALGIAPIHQPGHRLALTIPDYARLALGLTAAQADRLFDAPNTLQQLQDIVTSLTTDQTAPTP